MRRLHNGNWYIKYVIGSYPVMVSSKMNIVGESFMTSWMTDLIVCVG